MTLYAEDLPAGAEFDLGTYFVSRSELLQFAERWDPQAFHTDPAAAGSGRFGDVIASGAHSIAIAQRLAVVAVEHDWATIAGIEIRQVRFTAPVRPDTTLSGWLRIEAVELDPDRRRGIVTKHTQLRNGGELIMELHADAYVRMRCD